jgi:hypothetical protein
MQPVARHRSMADDTLNLRFGKIEHGWLPITLCLSGDDVTIDASDVPADPIAPLVSLARFLLSTERGSREIEFHLEPAYCVVTATKHVDDGTVDFRLVDPSHNLTSQTLSCAAVAAQIWRGIRRIETVIQTALLDKQWSLDFPSTQMQLLATEIETARAAH